MDPSKDQKMSYKKHLFICTNAPDNSKKCGSKGADILRQKIKELAKNHPNLVGEKIRVNASGCLGYCEHGIAAVCYPKGDWLLDLKNDETSVNALIDQLVD